MFIFQDRYSRELFKAGYAILYSDALGKPFSVSVSADYFHPQEFDYCLPVQPHPSFPKINHINASIPYRKSIAIFVGNAAEQYSEISNTVAGHCV
jgi:hypothetical protein